MKNDKEDETGGGATNTRCDHYGPWFEQYRESQISKSRINETN